MTATQTTLKVLKMVGQVPYLQRLITVVFAEASCHPHDHIQDRKQDLCLTYWPMLWRFCLLRFLLSSVRRLGARQCIKYSLSILVSNIHIPLMQGFLVCVPHPYLEFALALLFILLVMFFICYFFNILFLLIPVISLQLFTWSYFLEFCILHTNLMSCACFINFCSLCLLFL